VTVGQTSIKISDYILIFY